MCPTEDVRVLDKLHLGMRYSAFGREFNVDTTDHQRILNKVSLNRNTHKTGCILISWRKRGEQRLPGT